MTVLSLALLFQSCYTYKTIDINAVVIDGKTHKIIQDYEQRNPQKVKAARKARYDANPELENAKNKAWREANLPLEKA